MIDCHVDVSTTDGYKFRVFCVGYTHKRPNQIKKTSYAQSTQVRQIRAKMTEIIMREVSTCDLKPFVQKPKLDLTRLMDMHGEGKSSGNTAPQAAGAAAEGAVVSRSDDYEPPVQEAV